VYRFLSGIAFLLDLWTRACIRWVIGIVLASVLCVRVLCCACTRVCCLAGACEWMEMHGSIWRELFVHSRYMGYVVCVGEISMSWEIAWCIYDIWKNIKKNRRLVFAFCQINVFRVMYVILL